MGETGSDSMFTELVVTLQGQIRTSAEHEELLCKWDELSNHQIGLVIPRYEQISGFIFFYLS